MGDATNICYVRIMRIELIQNEKEGQTELHISGEFIAGWKRFELSDDVKKKVCHMIDEAFQEGERNRSKNILHLLRSIT